MGFGSLLRRVDLDCHLPHNNGSACPLQYAAEMARNRGTSAGDHQSLSTWLRKSSRLEFETDTAVMAVGFTFVFLGGIVSVAGLQSKTSNNSAPQPLLGAVIALCGATVFLVGLLLLIANAVAWVRMHHRHGLNVQADDIDRDSAPTGKKAGDS
jgi:cytochrome c biogenesis protein CcdA